MKPILLKLRGLQSYREMQEVDFERLTEAGVFGIFGTTGSGKSSILDAVTLALYGKVERAANGTQGIMNQAEKQLSVAFTFEMSGGGERKRYRVERQFKRGGDVSVSNTLSRFIEQTEEGEIVHADKLADVTRMVELHIGLSMQDFTRAVVLPQGKFAEFLSLTGKDRRQMLQRLFRLERFGDGLALKLNQRMKAAEAGLNEAAAEQLGLGDASEAAIDAAAQRHREAAEASAAGRAKLAEAERLHAEQLQVRQRQEELRQKESQQTVLEAGAAQVAELELQLGRLAAAEKLLPFLDALDAAEAAANEAMRRLAASEQAFVSSEAAAKAAASAASAAELEAAAAEPRLAQRLEQLAGAQRLEGETASLAAAEQELNARHADSAAQQQGFAEQSLKVEETLNRYVQAQNKFKQDLKQVEMTGEERNRRSAMAKQLVQLQSIHTQLETARREADNQHGVMLQLQKKQAAAEAAATAAAASVAGAVRALIPLSHDLQKLELDIEQLLKELPDRIEQARRALLEQQREQLAAQLSVGLHEGEPCPVCGSCIHPKVHAGEAASALQEVSEDEAAAWERLAQQGQRLQFKLSANRGKVDNALERLKEAIGTAEGGEEINRVPLTLDPALLEAAAGSAVLASPLMDGMSLADIQASLEQAASLSASVEHNLAEQEAGWGRLRTHMQEAQRAAESASMELRSIASIEQAAQSKAKELEAAFGEEAKLWEKQFGEAYQSEQAQAAIEAYEQREKQTEVLRARLEKSVFHIDEERKSLDNLRIAEQQAKLAAVELGAKLEAQRQQLAQKREQLLELTGGTPAASLIQAAEQELSALRTKVSELKEASLRAQRLLQQAAEERSAAAEGEKATAARKQECRTAWEAALTASPFTAAADVRPLRPLLVQQEKIAAQIEQYRKAERELAAQIDMLRGQLGGRSITDEAWQACVSALAEAKSASDEALQLLAKSQRDLEELQAKRERWSALEEKRLSMEALCGRLKSLQTVFRGNAFVEYVAEEQLVQVCRAASERLGYLTKRRYALEVDSGGGFVIRDDASGGIRRPVSTLSGGETFLASLALALALSGQIQLRGKYPLQFFFLDEGFGTLDPELLDTVITALEKLQNDKLSVGVISHVPELRARLPRRLIVTAAEPSGRGSTVALETM